MKSQKNSLSKSSSFISIHSSHSSSQEIDSKKQRAETMEHNDDLALSPGLRISKAGSVDKKSNKRLSGARGGVRVLIESQESYEFSSEGEGHKNHTTEDRNP